MPRWAFISFETIFSTFIIDYTVKPNLVFNEVIISAFALAMFINDIAITGFLGGHML